MQMISNNIYGCLMIFVYKGNKSEYYGINKIYKAPETFGFTKKISCNNLKSAHDQQIL